MLYGLEKKHIRAFNLVLVILLGVSLGYLFSALSNLYLQRRAPLPAVSGSRDDVKASQASLQSFQPILKNNLFDPGNRSQPEFGPVKEQPQMSQPAASERKDLVLLGTVISPENPFAVIQAGGEEGIFHLKDEVPGGGKLENIRREEVRIRDRDGTLFTLTLPKTAVAGSGAQPTPPQPQSGGIKQVGENRWVVSSQEAQKARQNMGVLMRQARFEPSLNNGRIEGFEVKMIRPRTLLWDLGLKRGDVIREINGVQLDSPEKALEIFHQLQEARNISIALQRRGEFFTFEYEVE